MTLQLRYRADIWVEVDLDADEVVRVVVDQATMAHPGAMVGVGEVATRSVQEAAERIAADREWPSWDYGSRPV